jgi:hypothetical protein
VTSDSCGISQTSCQKVVYQAESTSSMWWTPCKRFTCKAWLSTQWSNVTLQTPWIRRASPLSAQLRCGRSLIHYRTCLVSASLWLTLYRAQRKNGIPPQSGFQASGWQQKTAENLCTWPTWLRTSGVATAGGGRRWCQHAGGHLQRCPTPREDADKGQERSLTVSELSLFT